MSVLGEIIGRKSIFSKDQLWVWFVLVIYAIILGITIFRHEPWGDEAQAWLLARDASLADLFVKYLRYEGSPGLWHLILMIPAKLHFPYITLQIIAGLFALAGIFVFLNYAPFPRYIKAIFPFGYFMLYQYAAVARVYTVFPVVLFLLAMVYKDRMKRPYVFMGLLCLLSLLSVHGVVISLGLLLAHIIEVGKNWRFLIQKQKTDQIVSGLFYLILLFFIYLVLKVPNDYFNANSSFLRFNPVAIFRLSVFALSDALISNILYKIGIDIKDIILIVFSLFIWYLFAKFAWWSKKFKELIFPMTALLYLLFGVNYFSPWHTGLIFILLVFVLWICIDSKMTLQSSLKSKGFEDLQKAINVIITLVFLVQIVWSFNAIKFDWSKSYSGALGVARYIKRHHLENKVIFVNSPRAIAINGYFDHEIFANSGHLNRAFLVWSKEELSKVLTLKEIIERQPDLIIIKPFGMFGVYGNYVAPDLLNYKFDGIYNGGLYWKDRIFETETFLIYKKAWKLTNQKFTYDELMTAIKILYISNTKCLIKNKGKIIGSF